jgi:hypothetical protein
MGARPGRSLAGMDAGFLGAFARAGAIVAMMLRVDSRGKPPNRASRCWLTESRLGYGWALRMVRGHGQLANNEQSGRKHEFQ